ncbi:MAG: hypothetical protein LUH22_20365 [Bacteroides sp.]|nr:hypothetical protein [Bacteroides sp.]
MEEVKVTTTAALAVWNALSKTMTGVSIQELCQQLKMTFAEVIYAVRLLARDYNIGLQMQGEQLIVVGIE